MPSLQVHLNNSTLEKVSKIDKTASCRSVFFKKTEAAWPGLTSRKIKRFRWRKIKNVLFKILFEQIKFLNSEST